MGHNFSCLFGVSISKYEATALLFRLIREVRGTLELNADGLCAAELESLLNSTAYLFSCGANPCESKWMKVLVNRESERGSREKWIRNSSFELFVEVLQTAAVHFELIELQSIPIQILKGQQFCPIRKAVLLNEQERRESSVLRICCQKMLGLFLQKMNSTAESLQCFMRCIKNISDGENANFPTGWLSVNECILTSLVEKVNKNRLSLEIQEIETLFFWITRTLLNSILILPAEEKVLKPFLFQRRVRFWRLSNPQQSVSAG